MTGLRARVIAVLAALGMLGAASCGDPRPPLALERPAVLAPSPPAVPHRAGVRIDLAGQVRHARGLVRQPDGSYRTMCIDAPGALRPAAADPVGARHGNRR